MDAESCHRHAANPEAQSRMASKGFPGIRKFSAKSSGEVKLRIPD